MALQLVRLVSRGLKKPGQMTLTGTSVKDDDEADEQSAAYEQDFGGERKNSAISEMTEFESDEEA